jgi:hypothetical protein
MIKNIIDLLQEYNKVTGDIDIDLAIGKHQLPLTFKEAKRLIKLRYGSTRN